MNLFSRIKKMFGIEELSKVLLKHETLEPDNDYVTRQIVMDANGKVHEVYYHNRCTDYLIGDVLPEQIKKDLWRLVR
ncbi:MAG: hypothetical protein JU82_05165 [Sulfuricurvum sp. MLSB]|uniref:hypothetical protein n=1 Tax=Sulfuricurvum sp. MLSB TaxID=1537917 RepID=UPI00050397E0|nr:hypothetical protein [Sulfuricurvum sp. MLSB]KFN40005.1 MAG: hypothetical protein JU82_05165 [Sulfuricurvum sp. MLSB]